MVEFYLENKTLCDWVIVLLVCGLCSYIIIRRNKNNKHSDGIDWDFFDGGGDGGGGGYD